MPPYIQQHANGVVLSVRVQPRASRNELCGVIGAELKIRLTAPPVDSAANEALIEFLSHTLDCPKRYFQILSGHASRHKKVLISGLSATDLSARLS